MLPWPAPVPQSLQNNRTEVPCIHRLGQGMVERVLWVAEEAKLSSSYSKPSEHSQYHVCNVAAQCRCRRALQAMPMILAVARGDMRDENTYLPPKDGRFRPLKVPIP